MTDSAPSDLQQPPPRRPGAPRPDLSAPLYGASFGQAFTRFWRKYAVFTGRASLSEFWWAYLGIALVFTAGSVVIGVLSAVLVGLSAATDTRGPFTALIVLMGFTVVLGALALVVPSLAIHARRFHDANQSALLLLLLLIPYVGFIPVLIIALLPTDPRGARFDLGADPTAFPPAPYPPAPGYPQQSGPQQPVQQQIVQSAPLLGQPDLSMPPATRPAAVVAGAAQQSAAETAAESAARTRPTEPIAPLEPTAAGARRATWARVGAVQDDVLRHLLPPTGSGPDWPGPRRAFVRVSTADGIDIVASDGLTDGADAGLGAEVYLAVQRDAAAAEWRAALLVQTAQNIAYGAVRLREQVQQHGALSLGLPGIDAPAQWRGADDAVGVLLGLPLVGVPEQLALPGGSAILVGVVPLRPDELQRILTEGPAARLRIAASLSALSPQHLTAPDRPSVA